MQHGGPQRGKDAEQYRNCDRPEIDQHDTVGLNESRDAIEVIHIAREDVRARDPSQVLLDFVEVVRNRETREPMAPFNGTAPEMQALGKFFRQEGLYTFVRWNTFFTNPPLCITEAELREAFAIIDKGLEITDRVVS